MARSGWPCIGSSRWGRLLPMAVVPLLMGSPADGQESARTVWSIDSLSMPLYQVRSVLAVADSMLWVTDGGTGIHRLTMEGEYLGSVGGMGSGPGEYRWPWSIFSGGPGKVGVFDRRLLRVNYYDPAGRYLSSSPLQIVENVRGRVQAIDVSGERPLVWTDNYPAGDPREDEQTSFVWAIDTLGLPQVAVLQFPGPESIILRDDGLSSRLDAPFQRRPHVVILKNTILLGSSRSDTVFVYDRQGRVQRSFALPVPVREVSAKDRESYRSHQRKTYFDELERQRYGPKMRRRFTDRFDRLLDLARFPRRWQRYDLLAVGSSGTLWVMLPRSRDGWDRVWIEVDMEGRLLRSVNVPHAYDVMCAAIANGRLYVGEWNEEETRGRIAAYQVRP